MAPADLPYLQHMLDAVDRLQRYVGDQSRDRFEGDEVLQDAVIRQLEILGEAASRVTPEFRDSVPEIPWSKVIGTRHRLIHGYLSVDFKLSGTQPLIMSHASAPTWRRPFEVWRTRRSGTPRRLRAGRAACSFHSRPCAGDLSERTRG
jgi:uncharacterized protein with HEPN domain